MLGFVVLGGLSVVSFAIGIILNLQWFPKKDGTPPPRPLPQWAAVGLLVVLAAAAVLIFLLFLNR